ncbi:hypothetical protein [Stenotrophomonas sp. AS1]|uniref:hypothetical protein n=1 Tax=Stenotrophomonas sp. AS1 TaxID=3029188 RepID=UPI003B7B1C44
MFRLFIPLLALLSAPAFATVITTVDPQAFNAAVKPTVTFQNGICTVEGALIVANELVSDAHIVIRANQGTSPVAEARTGRDGRYSVSFASKKGASFQEVVISKPDKAGKISAVPGPMFVCGVKQ